MSDVERFSDVRYEDFSRFAKDPNFSRHERIGFPNSYREGFGEAIFSDIRSKLTHLDRRNLQVVEIGPGCGDPAHLMIEQCRRHEHFLTLVDCQEMLDLLPDAPGISKIAGRFPDCQELLKSLWGKADVVLSYSVMQTGFKQTSIFHFFDTALQLLAPGGQLLIGDLPNISQRKRFFASATGQASHRVYTGKDELPQVEFNRLEPDHLDDAVLLGLVSRARAAGFHAYVMPQGDALPMSNRREDLLVRRP